MAYSQMLCNIFSTIAMSTDQIMNDQNTAGQSNSITVKFSLSCVFGFGHYAINA